MNRSHPVRRAVPRIRRRPLLPMMEGLEDRRLLATFMVSNTNDDTNPGSLRSAITRSNSSPGPNIIDFAIPGGGIHSIALTSALPAITAPVTIDATTQPGYTGSPLVELNGAGAGSKADGLDVSAGNTTIAGLAINRFAGAGISLMTTGGDTIRNNYIGTDPTGAKAEGNGGDGVLISTGNRDQILNNVVSGNGDIGIYLNTAFLAPTVTGTVIRGNLIGTNAAGTATLGNKQAGIDDNNTADTTIGGTTAAARNLISGNTEGARLHNSTGLVFQGNYIGTDVTGSIGLGNGPNGAVLGDGIALQGASNALIGGTTPGAGNLISGNQGFGINSFVIGSSDITIQGNLIGTDASGTAPLGNGRDGVFIWGETNVLLGGAGPGAGNVISNNANDGVNTFASAVGFVIQGNKIGTDITGKLPMGNRGDGVELSVPGVSVGGLTPGAGNIIAFNGGAVLSHDAGVEVSNHPDTILSNSIFDNLRIGIDLDNGSGNNGQGAPTLSSAASDGTSTTVVGTLTGTPNATYTVQFFASDDKDPAGNAEGESFLGTVTLKNGPSGSLPFHLAVPAGAIPGQFVTATATDPGGDTSQFSAPVTATGDADVGVKVLASAATVQVGQDITYTITVANAGPTEARNVTLTDTLPAGETYVSSSSSQDPQPTEAGGTVTDDIGTLAPNASVTVTVVVATTPAASPSVKNIASVTSIDPDPTPNNNTASATTNVTPLADLTVGVIADKATVAVGQSVTYTVTVSNAGPSDATSVVLTDTLPKDATIVSAMDSLGASLATTNGTLTDDLGTVASGDSVTLTIVVQPGAGDVPILDEKATVKAAEADPTPNDETFTLPTTVTPVADLGVKLVADQATVPIGGTLKYTVALTNNGPSPATNVLITDLLPAGVLFDSAVDSVGGSPKQANGAVTDTVASLASGATVTLTILVTPTVTSAGTITDSVTAGSAVSDPVAANDSASVMTAVAPVADLAVTMAALPASVPVDQDVTYQVKVTNNGPSTASDVKIVDTLPSGTAFLSETDSDGTTGLQPVGETLTDTVATLASGDSITLTIVVVASPIDVPSIKNTVTASATETDSDPTNNTAKSTTQVTPVANLVVTITPPTGPILVGQDATYTVTVVNNGPSPATKVSLKDTLPAGATFVTASDSLGGTPKASGGTVTDALGTLAEGDSAVVTIVVNLGAAGSSTDSATVSATEMNSNPTDGSTSVSVPVTQPTADLSVAIAPPVSPIPLGQNLTYTLTVTNAGPFPATNVQIVDTLPAGATFIQANDSLGMRASASVGTVTDTIPLLASGATATLTIVVTPTSTGTITDSATVSAAETDPNPTNNGASVSSVVSPVADLAVAVQASRSQVTRGQQETYTVTVTNKGPSDASGVILKDTLPTGATVVSVNAGGAAVTQTNGSVVAAIGALPSGGSATVTIVVTVGVPGTITDSASVTATEIDPAPANNTASASVGVLDLPGTLEFAATTVNTDEDAGTATITVTRTNGVQGSVSVAYQTVAGGLGTAGVDYTPVSGTLVFGPGETTKTFTVPVLPDPFDNRDETVALTLNTPGGGAVLGTPAAATLVIKDLDPDSTPPAIQNLVLIGPATSVSFLTLIFSKGLNVASATNTANYQLFAVGSTGQFVPSQSPPVPIAAAGYDAANHAAVLLPTAPLAPNTFYYLVVSGVTDAAGNPLASTYATYLARGTSLSYFDSQGQLVSLALTGPGVFDLTRHPNGDGQTLQVLDPAAAGTVLTGTVQGGGTTRLDAITGLGIFGQVRVNMATPPFEVTHLPFELTTVSPPAIDVVIGGAPAVTATPATSAFRRLPVRRTVAVPRILPRFRAARPFRFR